MPLSGLPSPMFRVLLEIADERKRQDVKLFDGTGGDNPWWQEFGTHPEEAKALRSHPPRSLHPTKDLGWSET